MRRIGTSHWFVLRARCSPDARFEYLLERGTSTGRDESNPISVMTLGTERSVVQGPQVRQAPRPTKKLPAGELLQFDLVSEIRGNERRVDVYLPAAYRPDGPPLPTLYVHDGSRFRAVADLRAGDGADLHHRRCRFRGGG